MAEETERLADKTFGNLARLRTDFRRIASMFATKEGDDDDEDDDEDDTRETAGRRRYAKTRYNSRAKKASNQDHGDDERGRPKQASNHDQGHDKRNRSKRRSSASPLSPVSPSERSEHSEISTDQEERRRIRDQLNRALAEGGEKEAVADPRRMRRPPPSPSPSPSLRRPFQGEPTEHGSDDTDSLRSVDRTFSTGATKRG